MKYFKFVALLSAFVLISTAAWAGSPEFDAVGDDAYNYYAWNNLIYKIVTEKGAANQYDSYFYFPPVRYADEGFEATSGAEAVSPCYFENPFHENGEEMPMYGVLTDQWNEGIYKWTIVLQMKPETDLNLNIYDCVLAHYDWRSSQLFYDATQMGRARTIWGEPVFESAYSPLITAYATPGPYATPGFEGEQALDARTLPGLAVIPLAKLSYTSKAHWPEGIIIAKPQTGVLGAGGEPGWTLKQGDAIHVVVEIYNGNTADVWYGRDSVILKYVGLLDTDIVDFD